MKFRVQTAWPLARSSNDHLYPRGTKNDNSTNPEFNRLLIEVLWDNLCAIPKVLDLGCAGGGFVESIHAMHLGIIAVGIDGSDYSKREKRAAWKRWADERLFTANIGMPFFVLQDGRLAEFNVITLWEVLEHLSLTELEVLHANAFAHLRKDGLLIVSINKGPDVWEGREYHVTQRSSEWWFSFFEDHGWRMREDLWERFHPHWVRGPNTEGVMSTCFVFQK